MKTNEELWKGIANHFGVELGEEFRIKEWDYCSTDRYRFSDRGLEVYYSKNDWREDGNREQCLLHEAAFSIIKLPWKPKNGDCYYKICINKIFYIVDCTWADDDYDKSCYALGNCFKTSEEAEAKMKQLMEVLKK